MHEMTANNLRSAYGGESMAHMRYKTWADKAREEGFPNAGRLFDAVAYAEVVHANNHFEVLGREKGGFTVNAGAVFGLGKTADHLEGGIEGETFEIDEMYPAYIAVAKAQKEDRALETFEWALKAEKIHAAMYKKAKQALDSGKDFEIGALQVCGRCGFTKEGEAPDTCPVCGAPGDRFKAFE